MKSTDTEIMDYFADNGFFSNDFQEESIVIKVEDKNEITFVEEKSPMAITESKVNTKENLANFLYDLYDNSGGDIGLPLLALLTIFGIIIVACGFVDEKIFEALICLGIFSIVMVFLLILTFGDRLAAEIYASNRNLKLGQMVYTLNYNNEVVPVRLESIRKCDSKIKIECVSNLHIHYDESEIFSYPELAAEQALELHRKRVIALSEHLGDKAEAFLKSKQYHKYAELYYNYYHENDRDSIYDFLISKKSFVRFCNFIKELMDIESQENKKRAEQEKKDSYTVDSVIDSFFKNSDQM